jgi:hypothetical protein
MRIWLNFNHFFQEKTYFLVRVFPIFLLKLMIRFSVWFKFIIQSYQYQQPLSSGLFPKNRREIPIKKGLFSHPMGNLPNISGTIISFPFRLAQKTPAPKYKKIIITQNCHLTA